MNARVGVQSENEKLRQALEKLQESVDGMQTEFESSLSAAEESFNRRLELMRDEFSLQQQQLQQNKNSATSAVATSPVLLSSEPEPLFPRTPLPRCRVAEKFIDGLGAMTPVVRPVSIGTD